MSSSQANGTRKKVISSTQESTTRRDENRKRTSTTKKDEEKSITVNSQTVKRNLNKNLVKQDSLGNSTSRSRSSTDKSVNSKNISSKTQSSNNHNNKISNKISSSPRISASNDVKPKLIKQRSDEKRGLSTIYMPKKSLATKQSSQSIIKNKIESERTRAGDKSSNKQNDDKSKYKHESTTKVKESSNVGSSSNKKRLPSRERRKSRTLSPSEVKVLNRKLNVTSSSGANKPGSSSSDYEYEDDFEDYESDFQECTDSDEKSSDETSSISESSESSSSSEPTPVELKIQPKNNEEQRVNTVLPKRYVEEESMLDSGHYELQEARRRAARIDLMSASSRVHRIPHQVLERPVFLPEEEITSEKEVRAEVRSLPSSADEGFEEGRSGDFVKSSPTFGSNSLSDKTNDKLHKLKLDNINGSDEESKKESKYLIRGRQLMQMIKLDRVGWSLYESTPIPYEDFIRIHGKMNTRQISTQTNDDNLSIDVQTDEIESRSVWTQFPIVCRNNLKTNEDVKVFRKELIGVGGDDDDDDDLYLNKNRVYYDVLQLNDFLLNAGKLVLALLEGKSSSHINLVKNDSDGNNILPFSEGSITLSVESVTFLTSRPVIEIKFSEISYKMLLTIHDRVDEDVQTTVNDNSYITDCCIGCLWNIFEPSKPVKIFYSSSNITACCFHPTNYNIIYGGLEDGSLSLWDLGEDEFYHRRIHDKENDANWILRSATFNSTGNFDENESNSSKIVAVTILSKIYDDPGDITGKFMPVEVCSLSENGNCIIWSVLKNFKGTTTDDLGQSWWGKLRLIKSHEIPLNIYTDMPENFMQEFKDICVDCVNVNSLYVTCNSNKVLHATRIGKKAQPRCFNSNDFTASMTCIEKCPFNESYFLVGCEDSSLYLFSSKLEKPVLYLKNPNSTAAIKIIQWSRSKPLTIYVLDTTSRIHVWNLNNSDIIPMLSISLEKNGHVDSMQLSQCRSNHDLINQYMALGRNNGSVEIHKFNKQFYYSNRDIISSELEELIKYLSIC